MNTWVRVGAKCVCMVDFSRFIGDCYYGEVIPVKGATYTIRSVVAFPDGVGIRLVEIVNKPQLYDDGITEAAFVASCFRPLVSLEDDIALFTSMRPGIDLIAERLDEFAR